MIEACTLGRGSEGLDVQSPGRPRANGLPRVASAFPAVILLLAPLLGCGREDVIDDPIPLYGEVPIEYPLDLWDANVEGVTLLRVRVTEMGVVDSVEVMEGSGYPAFDAAAVRGAFELRYSPARKNGERTTVWAKVPVHFTKEDS